MRLRQVSRIWHKCEKLLGDELLKAIIAQLISPETKPSARAEFFAGLPDLSVKHEIIYKNDVYQQGFRAHIISPEQMVCSLPVAGNSQYYGVFNGGSTALLGETTGSIAANLMAREGTMAVGIDISVQHLLPAYEGRVYCLATLLHKGRIVRYRLDFYRADGEQSAVGTHSCTFVSRVSRPN